MFLLSIAISFFSVTVASIPSFFWLPTSSSERHGHWQGRTTSRKGRHTAPETYASICGRAYPLNYRRLSVHIDER